MEQVKMKRSIRVLMLLFVFALTMTAGNVRSVKAADSGKTEDGLEWKTINNGTNVEITYYYGTKANVTIPSQIDGKAVTSIGYAAFYMCQSVTSITIPSGVTRIGEYAFTGCYGLKTVTIPSSVTKIGKQAFQDCSSLTGIKLPNGITSIESYTFSGCYDLKNITIPSKVTKIEKNAFSNCWSLTNVKIPSKVINIGDEAFKRNIKLSKVTIGASVKKIGKNAFNGCANLKTITIKTSKLTKKSIGSGAFKGIYPKATFKCPNKKLKNYKKWIKKAGAPKKAKYKK